MLLRLFISFFMILGIAHAESIKSITGNIIFDVNEDGNSEAKLTSGGLAIGSGLSPSANLHVQGNGIVTGDLVIGGTAGNSTLEVQGSVGYVFQTVSSNTTLADTNVVLVDSSSDNVTVTLPYAGNVIGRAYTIKKISSSNQVVLNGGGNIIDSSLEYTYSSGNTASMKVLSDGTKWLITYKSSTGLSGAAWSPADLTTLLWLDASDSSTITESSGAVSQWDDKSGNGYNATQATASKKPTTDSVTINSINAIDFDGSSDEMSLSGLPLDDEHTIYVVGYNTSNGYRTYLRADPAGQAHLNFGAGNGNQNFATFYGNVGWDDANTNTPALSISSATIMGIVADGGGNAIPYHNGTAQNSKACSMPSRTDFNLGSSIGQQYWDGPIAEVVMTSTALSTSDRQKLEGYLAHKWGLEGSLPSGHPYENTAP